jgi:hypothetical protein
MYRFVERLDCPACKSRESLTLWDSRFDEEPLARWVRVYYRVDPALFDGRYRLDRCLDCDLVFQRFVGDAETLRAVYSDMVDDQRPESIPTYVADMADIRGSRDAHELMTLSAYLGKPRLRVFDFGTGWGLWPTIAHRLGHDAYASELVRDRVEFVSAHGVTILDEPEGEFDVINLEQVLEHVPNPLEILETLVPHLKGILKIAVPNVRNSDIQALSAGRYPMPIHPLEHINGFNRRSMEKLASRLGLRIVRPTLAQSYAFIRGGIPATPKRIIKELVRPFWYRPTNLYVWLAR